MMQHDRRGRLLRVELVLVGQHDADLRRLEQAQELLLVLQLRAGRVAEGVARAAIALAEHGIEVAGVLVAEAELAPDPLVDILGQRLGHLDAEAVQVERSEERRVGKECVRTWRSRWWPYH